jgi:DNA-binding XRE family transcriptional regulator
MALAAVYRVCMDAATLRLLIEARSAARTGSGADVRCAAGLSQGELARAAGINPATVSRWESQERQPTGPAAIRYARVLRLLAAGTPEMREAGFPASEPLADNQRRDNSTPPA